MNYLVTYRENHGFLSKVTVIVLDAASRERAIKLATDAAGDEFGLFVKCELIPPAAQVWTLIKGGR